MRRRAYLEQAWARFVPGPLQTCDRSIRRPLGAWQYFGPEVFPEVRPHYPPVRDDDEARASRVEGADGTQGRLKARDDLLIGLRADERPTFLLGHREKLLRQLGISMLLLGPGVALEDASSPLAQAA